MKSVCWRWTKQLRSELVFLGQDSTGRNIIKNEPRLPPVSAQYVERSMILFLAPVTMRSIYPYISAAMMSFGFCRYWSMENFTVVIFSLSFLSSPFNFYIVAYFFAHPSYVLVMSQPLGVCAHFNFLFAHEMLTVLFLHIIWALF